MGAPVGGADQQPGAVAATASVSDGTMLTTRRTGPADRDRTALVVDGHRHRPDVTQPRAAARRRGPAPVRPGQPQGQDGEERVGEVDRREVGQVLHDHPAGRGDHPVAGPAASGWCRRGSRRCSGCRGRSCACPGRAARGRRPRRGRGGRVARRPGAPTGPCAARRSSGPDPLEVRRDVREADRGAVREPAHVDEHAGSGEQPQVQRVDPRPVGEEVVGRVTVRAALRAHAHGEQVVAVARDRRGGREANRRVAGIDGRVVVERHGQVDDPAHEHASGNHAVTSPAAGAWCGRGPAPAPGRRRARRSSRVA